MPSSGEQPAPLLIGASSSTIGIMLSRILGPLSVPVVSSFILGNKCLMKHLFYTHTIVSVLFLQISYLASSPSLSDRSQFPNFFRTIPSDIYQARAMAQLAIRFQWTWIGAVLENSDYGRLAVQVYFYCYYTITHVLSLYTHICKCICCFDLYISGISGGDTGERSVFRLHRDCP